MVVGDGDTQFEHAAQQSVLLVGHAALFALVGDIAKVAFVVQSVFFTAGVIVQQVAELGVIKVVQLRVGLILCDGIGQVVFLVLIGEGAVPIIMGFIQNVLHIKGVLRALIILHSDIGGIGVILIFLGAEILGFRVLLACHRDGQGGAGGLGGRAGIHLDGGGLLLALRVGVLFGQGVGAVAVIRVTGFDQLGNVKPGHLAGFNFVFFGQGEFLFAVLFHGAGYSVITELGIGFGIPAQVFAVQFLLQAFLLHVLRRVFLRLGAGLTLDLGGGFKRSIGGGGSRGRGRTVRVSGCGGRGGRLAQHKLRVLGLRLGLFSVANGLFLCLAAAVLGAFLLIVQVGLGLLAIALSLLAIALSLLAVAGGLLRAGLALFGHIAVHSAGALGGGGRIVLGDLVVVVVIIHADIRVADHIHSALALLVGHRIGRHTGSSNGCRSRAFPFRLGLVDVCVIRVDVLICRIRDQGLGRNTCGQCHRHCSNFKFFIRHDPRSPFLSPCV